MNVLLIEDDGFNRDLLADELSLRGYSVTSVESAEVAITLCEQQYFALVLADYNLPEMTGIDFARKLRESGNEDTYLMMITGHDSAALLEEAVKTGFDDYVAKPISARTLQIRLSIAEKKINYGQIKKMIERENEFLQERQVESEAEQREIMERTQSFSNLNQLAAGFFRDVEEPLRLVYEQLDAMANEGADSGGLDARVTVTRKLVDDIATTTSHFSELSPHTGARRVENARLVLDVVVSLVKKDFEAAGIVLDVDVGAAECQLFMTRHHLMEVILSMLVNAREAMPKGGTVCLHAERSNENLMIEVKDNGEGMSPTVVEHVFDPFYSTKGSFGTGLGLSISDRVVREAGGSIKVASESEEGSRFTISLPVWEKG